MFQKYFLIFMLMLISFYGICQSENSYNNKIGLKLGYAGLRFQDKVISTFAYSGDAVPFEINYDHESSRIKFNSSFTINAGDTIHAICPSMDGFSYSGDYGTSAENSYNNLDHRTLKSDFSLLDVSFQFRVAHWKEEKLNLFFGLSYNIARFQKRYLMIDNTNNSNSKYNAISLISSLDYKLATKHRFSYVAWLPIYTHSTRTLYLEYGNPPVEEYKSWSSLGNYLSLNNKFIYTFQFARRWSLEAQYRFSYYKYKLPRQDKAVVQLMTAGVNFHF